MHSGGRDLYRAMATAIAYQHTGDPQALVPPRVRADEGRQDEIEAADDDDGNEDHGEMRRDERADDHGDEVAGRGQQFSGESQMNCGEEQCRSEDQQADRDGSDEDPDGQFRPEVFG